MTSAEPESWSTRTRQHRFRVAVENESPTVPENPAITPVGTGGASTSVLNLQQPISAGPSSASSGQIPMSSLGTPSLNGPFMVFEQMPIQRSSSKYREKFNQMREKYERVTLKQTDFQRELAIAEEKAKSLQAENDLLLDALSVAYTRDPSRFRFAPGDEPFPIPVPNQIPIPPHEMDPQREPGPDQRWLAHEAEREPGPEPGRGLSFVQWTPRDIDARTQNGRDYRSPAVNGR